MRKSSFLLTSLFLAAAGSASAVTLDSYSFDNSLMGDTVTASDGGTFQSFNWLNTTNTNPGLTGSLTGANFDTGIANINGSADYTIGYTGGILNGAGDDLGIVVARYSSDNIQIALSTDGVTFGSTYQISSATAAATSTTKNYYYNNNGPYGATLYVHSLDLSNFGVLGGQSVLAVKIGVGTGSNELDLVRVGGFTQAVPEPASMAALGLGGLALLRRRRKS